MQIKLITMIITMFFVRKFAGLCTMDGSSTNDFCIDVWRRRRQRRRRMKLHRPLLDSRCEFAQVCLIEFVLKTNTWTWFVSFSSSVRILSHSRSIFGDSPAMICLQGPPASILSPMDSADVEWLDHLSPLYPLHNSKSDVVFIELNLFSPLILSKPYAESFVVV